LHRIFGTDLTTIPGIDVLTAHTLLTEVGPDLSKFPTPDAFASWLGLCPDNRISGGKVLSVKTRRVKNRAALALRMSAQAVQGSRAGIGGYYRRMRAKLGGPKAITATAHKLVSVRQARSQSSRPHAEATARAGRRTRLPTGSRNRCSLGDLPVVLPRSRMLPDCLIEFVPNERTCVPCDRAASTGPREGA